MQDLREGAPDRVHGAAPGASRVEVMDGSLPARDTVGGRAQSFRASFCLPLLRTTLHPRKLRQGDVTEPVPTTALLGLGASGPSAPA